MEQDETKFKPTDSDVFPKNNRFIIRFPSHSEIEEYFVYKFTPPIIKNGSNLSPFDVYVKFPLRDYTKMKNKLKSDSYHKIPYDIAVEICDITGGICHVDKYNNCYITEITEDPFDYSNDSIHQIKLTFLPTSMS